MNEFWVIVRQECRRLAQRVYWRAIALKLRWQLGYAERKLGELGWQQADFEPGDAGVRELQRMEQQFAHSLFERSEIREQISSALECADDVSKANLRKLRVAEEVADTIESRCAQLLDSIQKEIRLESPVYILDGLKKSLETEEESLREVRQTIVSLHQAQALHLKDSEQRLNALRLALQKSEAEKTSSSRQMRGHFRKIGKDLADVGIAPLNQPEVLTKVLQLRTKQHLLRTRLEESLAVSVELTPLVVCTARFSLLFFAAVLALWLRTAFAWE